MRVPDRGLALLVAVPFACGFAAAPAPARAEVAFTFADPAIVESSGLALTDGLVATVNDSGDAGRVFAVDPATGRTVGLTSWAGEPTDVEAVATAGPGEVWVGDIGDNQAARDAVTVLRVPLGRGERTVEPERFELVYPDGPTDAESLLVDPSGRLVVVSKGLLGGTVYRAPARLDPDRPNRLEALGPALPIATDGAFLPDGRHLVVRNYGSASVLTWPALETVGSFDLPEQEQGEGLAVEGDDRLLLSTEGAFTDVLRVRLPRAVREAIAPPPSAPSSSAPSTPGAPADGSSAPADGDGPWWPWLAGGGLAVGALAVVLRVSLRR